MNINAFPVHNPRNELLDECYDEGVGGDGEVVDGEGDAF